MKKLSEKYRIKKKSLKNKSFKKNPKPEKGKRWAEG